MIVNDKIFQIAGELKNVVHEQMEQAQEAIGNLPEGETRDKLKDLLRRASSGKISHDDAQKEIQKIIANAS